MKIEWLNEEMTQARVTRGWFKKEQAILVQSKSTVDVGAFTYKYVPAWEFESTKCPVEPYVSKKLHRAKQTALAEQEWQRRHGKEWVPVKSTGQLPKAIVNKQD